MKPLISIIIPVYNVEAYISETLKSVFNQTFKDFEIIVVNDGSKDKTPQIVREILRSSTFPFKIIDQVNRGVSVARNVGFDHSEGRYIKFLDGDDKLVPNALEVLVNEIQKCSCGLVYGGQDVVTVSGKILYKYEDMYRQDWTVAGSRDAIIDFLISKIHISCNSCLIVRRIIEEHNIRFTPGSKYGEDNEFLTKVIYYSNVVHYVGQSICLATYREDSTTKTATLSTFHNVGVMKRLKKFFEENGQTEIVKMLDEYAIPSLYAWSLGDLAYNGYPYREWIKIARNGLIKQNIQKFKLPFENKTKFHKQMLMAKSIYLLSPTLAYLVMRIAKVVYTLNSRK
ncbi:MAG: glycosyltransferase family 2 protein [Fervidobacterium sp.]